MVRIITELLPRKLRNSLRESALIRQATRRQQSFYCRALAGESDFNVCINSDMTLSCNCQDFSGSGRIGDLKTHSLAEIFGGPAALRFRAQLAARQFPTPTCVNCADLRLLPRQEVEQTLGRYRLPSQGIMVENTALCNLRCHMCDRKQILELRGEKRSLSLQDVEQIALLLQQQGMKSLLYFNLGEPFLPGDIREQLTIIRSHNPELRIVTSTNGQLLSGADKVEAALLTDYIYFSLDGVSQRTVARYQVGASFDTAYRNMAQLVAERDRRGLKRPIIEWKYVLFRWNDHRREVAKAIELAQQAGVDVIGFYRGDGPLRHRSLRWYCDPYLKRLAPRTGDGIVVNLNNIDPQLLSP